MVRNLPRTVGHPFPSVPRGKPQLPQHFFLAAFLVAVLAAFLAALGAAFLVAVFLAAFFSATVQTSVQWVLAGWLRPSKPILGHRSRLSTQTTTQPRTIFPKDASAHALLSLVLYCILKKFQSPSRAFFSIFVCAHSVVFSNVEHSVSSFFTGQQRLTVIRPRLHPTSNRLALSFSFAKISCSTEFTQYGKRRWN